MSYNFCTEWMTFIIFEMCTTFLFLSTILSSVFLIIIIFGNYPLIYKIFKNIKDSSRDITTSEGRITAFSDCIIAIFSSNLPAIPDARAPVRSAISTARASVSLRSSPRTDVRPRPLRISSHVCLWVNNYNRVNWNRLCVLCLKFNIGLLVQYSAIVD